MVELLAVVVGVQVQQVSQAHSVLVVLVVRGHFGAEPTTLAVAEVAAETAQVLVDLAVEEMELTLVVDFPLEMAPRILAVALVEERTVRLVVQA
jgi:hypothetical protein